MSNMTKVQKFEAIKVALNGVDVQGFDVNEFINKEIDSINKKNARKSNSPTKTQKENEVIKASILDTLKASAEGMTASEVAKALDLSSPQKASALLSQLGKTGDVVKNKVGKATIFTVA